MYSSKNFYRINSGNAGDNGGDIKVGFNRIWYLFTKRIKSKNMSIYIDGLNSCYDYPEGAGEMYGTVLLQNTKIEEFDAIYQLAKKQLQFKSR